MKCCTCYQGLQGEQSVRRYRPGLGPRGDGVPPHEGPGRRRAAGHQGPCHRRQGILRHGADSSDGFPPQHGRRTEVSWYQATNRLQNSRNLFLVGFHAT